MPTAGLSLVGFLDQADGIRLLRHSCVCADESDTALANEWAIANAKLGTPIANAGNPNLVDIPITHPHVQSLLGAPYSQMTLPPFLMAGATFKMVEIEPLLAFQFNIDSVRSDHHCGTFNSPPTESQLLNVCLPLAPHPESIVGIPGPQSMLLKSPSLNVRPVQQGLINGQFAGIQFGQSLPLQHVVRLNGRCYLHNGFHRALGARLAGATHIPCLFRDVTDHAAAGIQTDGGTFSAKILDSADPPTLGHFTQGHAYDVQIRSFIRMLHVSWAEYAVPNE